MDLSDKEIDAVNKLISKLSPEDLERAAGGISPQARNILVALGAITIVTTTGLVLANKFGGGGTSSVDLGAEYNIIKEDEIMSNDKARELIKKYNISEKLVNSKEVDGEENPWKVFSKWTYYERNKDGTEGKLKSAFGKDTVGDGIERIYHKGGQSKTSWKGARYIIKSEEKRGVPVKLLIDFE